MIFLRLKCYAMNVIGVNGALDLTFVPSRVVTSSSPSVLVKSINNNIGRKSAPKFHRG